MLETCDRVHQTRILIQARMSSSRYPGKVLAPLQGTPLIGHLVSRIFKVRPAEEVIVLTSVEKSDDPLVEYLKFLGVQTFRGPLDNVFRRFQLCLEKFECKWFFRISADSPLFKADLINKMLSYSQSNEFDIVTNIFPRSFPKGHSLEMVRSKVFENIDSSGLTSDQKEHVTKVYYDNYHEYSIKNIHSGNVDMMEMNLCVDTIEDLNRLNSQDLREFPGTSDKSFRENC